jgi:3',5'-cyclic-AMP phosphodiesterase
MKDKRHNEISSNQLFSMLPEGSIRILQITDCHLYADPANSLAGINTEQSLLQLLNVAKERILPTDLILVTGDLIHDASAVGYQRLKGHILNLDIPTYCIPGNHDNLAVMEQNICCDKISTDTISTHGDWALIMLDSSVPGKVGGHLSREQLDQLRTGLETNADRHILVSLHHHPVSLGSAWIDQLALDNPHELFSILDQYPNVRGLLWGHAHQRYEGERNGVRLMGSPSTCIQFKPDQDNFAIDPVPPGLRWLALLPDGTIDTGIEFLEHTPAGIDLSVSGY